MSPSISFRQSGKAQADARPGGTGDEQDHSTLLDLESYLQALRDP